MTLDLKATPDTIRDVAEAMKLAAILDDRVAQADRARIAAWSEQVQRHNLGREDLLNGLQAFYDGPSERAIQIGDLIQHARNARRDRTMRAAEDEREARQEHYNQRAADEVRELSAAFIQGRVNETPRLKAARDAIYACRTKVEAKAAIAEFFAAKADARRPRLVSQ